MLQKQNFQGKENGKCSNVGLTSRSEERKEKNEDDFCEPLATQLWQLNPREKMVIKMQINNAVYNQFMKSPMDESLFHEQAAACLNSKQNLSAWNPQSEQMSFKVLVVCKKAKQKPLQENKFVVNQGSLRSLSTLISTQQEILHKITRKWTIMG